MKQSYATALMVLAMLIWGGSWVSGKVIAGSASPDLIIFVRFFLSFAVFLPFLPKLAPHLKSDARSLAATVLCAAILVVYNQFFFTGLKLGTAGHGGVIVTTLSPLCTFVLASVLFRKKISVSQGAGLALGLVSGIFLLEPWHASRASLVSSGTSFFLGAALLWALLTIMSQKIQSSLSVIGYSFYLYFFTALIQLPFCSKADFAGLSSLGAIFWLNMIFLAVFAATFATTAYFFASRRVGASRASSFMFMVPLSALIFSAVILGEIPSAVTLCGGCSAIAAVWLVNRKAA